MQNNFYIGDKLNRCSHNIFLMFFRLGNKTLGVQYVTSLYWAAATSASVGYGDIHAYTATEVLY